jgi:predicted metal-binding membrane protein
MPRAPNLSRDEIDHFVRLQPASGLRRASLGLLLSLVTLTAAAWVVIFLYALDTGEPMGVAVRDPSMAGMTGMAMAGMTAAGWSFAGALTFVMLWTVMMAAMMLPSAAPMIAIFAAKQARAGRDTAIPTWIFVAGYILVWAAVGVFVYVIVQAASDAATGLVPAERARWAPLALGATVLAAGLYQFTPLKRICLRHCRSPFGFVLRYWRDGKWGAFRMGLQHGAYCVGCCWALFAILTAAGVMSLAWMLLLTLLIFIEKVLPQSRVSRMIIGFLFVGLGVAVGTGVMPMPWAG